MHLVLYPSLSLPTDSAEEPKKMTPEQRKKFRQRLKKFRNLPPEKRRKLRKYRNWFQQLPPKRKRELRKRWKNMTPEERRRRLDKLPPHPSEN